MTSLLAPIRHIARLTLEAATPISTASGEHDAQLDVALSRDWNGLPCLSAMTIAGVLKAAHRDHWLETDALFGFEESRSKKGAASRLMVSFALAQDSKGCAHREILAPSDISDDPVLKLLAQPAPVLRDSVAIGEHGVAQDHAKFDRAACPRGTRFNLDLALDGEPADIEKDLKALLEVVALFDSPYLRFGGATRRGLGVLRLKKNKCWIASIDRRGDAGRNSWIAFRSAGPSDHPEACGFKDLGEAGRLPVLASKRQPETCVLTLSAKGLWRVGQGRQAWNAQPDDKENVALAPLTEPVIDWTEKNAKIVRDRIAIIPGAGIKGALAHRAEYHLRRMRKLYEAEQRHMNDLFGHVTETVGRAGSLFIDDAWVDLRKMTGPALKRTRNSLDRHTQGSRRGKLFTTEALWKGPKITIRLTRLGSAAAAIDVLQALDWAIEDLCEGRLALGAGAGVGDGVFEGTRSAWQASSTAPAAQGEAA